jgi:hypothetical protein
MNATGIAGGGAVGNVAAPFQVATLAPYGCSNEALCNILSASNKVRADGPLPTATNVWGPATGPANPAPSATPGGALQPLVWNLGAATEAQNWAAGCVWPHRPSNPYGESVFATGTPANGTDQVTGWAAEAADYTYATPNGTCAPTDQSDCEHYTQLVWRATNAVGCGIHTCETWTGNDPLSPPPTSPADFVVCDYSPPGNWGVAPY